MEPATLAWVLQDMPVDPGRLLLVETLTPSDLGAYRDALVRRLLQIAWPTAK